jgi:hypothetical protein
MNTYAPTVDGQPVCSEPVFVLGAPRSGTNALARSLHQHPDLWTSGESHILFQLFGQGRVQAAFESSIGASAGNWLKKCDVAQSELLRYLGLGMNALFSSRSGGKRWIDHTPHYALMGDTLAEMFPGARFLHILRDGRRVVHSMTNFVNRSSQGPDARPSKRVPRWASDFRNACRTWSRYVEAAMDLCERLPDRTITIRNEDLITSTDREFHRIYRFLAVPPDSRPIAFARSHRLNSSFGGPQTPLELSEPWTEWTKGQRAIFAEEAGRTLVSCGFAAEAMLDG